MQRHKLHLKDLDLDEAIGKLYDGITDESEDLSSEEYEDSESPEEEELDEEEFDPHTIMRFESIFIPRLVREYTSDNLSLETLTDTAKMREFVQLNDEYDKYLPAIERTKISVETDSDSRTFILYTFPDLNIITAAKYGAIVLTPDKSPEYYTLEHNFCGRMLLCSITVDLHSFIRFVHPEQTSAEDFVSLVKQTNAEELASKVKKREEQIKQLLRTTSRRTGD